MVFVRKITKFIDDNTLYYIITFIYIMYPTLKVSTERLKSIKAIEKHGENYYREKIFS